MMLRPLLFAALVVSLFPKTASAQQATRPDEPQTVLRLSIQDIFTSRPGCTGNVVCWSVRYPEGSGKYQGTDRQNAIDNADVAYSNWMMSNTMQVYTDQQVNARIDALRKELAAREALLEARIAQLEKSSDIKK
jgi:hypothetical protein